MKTILTALAGRALLCALIIGGAMFAAAPVQAQSVGFFQQLGTGADSRSFVSKMRDAISIRDFAGADCTGANDSTAAVRNARDALGVAGGTIDIPRGCFLKISGSGTEIVLLSTAVRFQCHGFASGGFWVDGATSSTTDIFRVAPPVGMTLYNVGMTGCQVVPLSGTPGRHVWNFDTTPGTTTTISEFLAKDNYFGSFGNYVFYNNTGGTTHSGGIYSAHFVRNVCAGSGSATAGGCFGGSNWGDSNHINGGRMAGNGYAVNISIFGGAGNFILENANLVSSSMVKLQGGYKNVIKDNTAEQQLLTNTSPSNAVFEITGGSVSTSIVGNQVVVGSGLGNPTPILIGTATGTTIDDNRIAPATDQNAIVDNGTGTYVGPRNTYSGPVSAAPAVSSGTSPLFISRNGGNISFGKDSAPKIPFLISQNAQQALAWPSGTNVGVIGADSTIATHALQSNGVETFSQYLGYMSRGTAASPTATQSGDTLAAFGGGGYTGSSFAAQAYFGTSAAQNWTGSNRGTYATIQTTPTNSTILTEVARFQGGLMVGTTSDPGFGIINALTGYRIGNSATSGNVLRGNGTNFVSATLACADLSNGTANCSAPVGQLPSTVTNDNAASQKVGEYVSSTLAAGSALSLSNTVTTDITSISLGAGDWDVWGTVALNPSGSTVTSGFYAWVSTASAAIPTVPNGGGIFGLVAPTSTGGAAIAPVGQMRLSLSTTTTVYLSTNVAFSGGTQAAYGFIGARRRR